MICIKCNKDKAIENFYVRKDSLKLRKICIECWNTYYRLKQREPEQILRRHERDLLNKYNLTLKGYLLLFDEQKGLCPICCVKLVKFSTTTHVDHDHNTNKVRGLLCAHCNLMLGHVKDQIFVLQAAIKYLTSI